jgi:hypothetical protein
MYVYTPYFLALAAFNENKPGFPFQHLLFNLLHLSLFMRKPNEVNSEFGSVHV